MTPSQNLLATLTAPAAEAYTRLDSYTLPLPDQRLTSSPTSTGAVGIVGAVPCQPRKNGGACPQPAIDVREGDVAIDFGTSSTVVAYTDNGQKQLLRIGAKDFWYAQTRRLRKPHRARTG